MNMDFLKIIFAMVAAYFISSCDKHEWKDTKKMFKPHGHTESGHNDEHNEAHQMGVGSEIVHINICLLVTNLFSLKNLNDIKI